MECLHLIAEERVTVLHGNEDQLAALLDAREEHPRVDLRSLRVALFPAGTDSAVPLLNDAQWYLCPTLSWWGTAATAGAVVMGYLDSSTEQRACSSGHPLADVETRIVDRDTGEDLPIGKRGEFMVRDALNPVGACGLDHPDHLESEDGGWIRCGADAIERPDGLLRCFGRSVPSGDRLEQ